MPLTAGTRHRQFQETLVLNWIIDQFSRSPCRLYMNSLCWPEYLSATLYAQPQCTPPHHLSILHWEEEPLLVKVQKPVHFISHVNSFIFETRTGVDFPLFVVCVCLDLHMFFLNAVLMSTASHRLTLFLLDMCRRNKQGCYAKAAHAQLLQQKHQSNFSERQFWFLAQCFVV